MNELKIFNSPEFGQVRTLTIGGEPWFIGKDVATILGYERTADAIRAHVDEDDKGVGEIQTPGGKQKIVIINESGLYSLVLSSKLPTAKKFKHWVTSEVLPAIRKHGAYLTPENNRVLVSDRMPGFLGRIIRFGRHRLCVAPSDYKSDSSAWLMIVLNKEFP